MRVALAFAALYSGAAQAQERRRPTDARNADVITAAVYHFPPELVLAEGQPPSGLGVDVLEAVARRARMRVRYRAFENGGDAMAAVAEGTADVVPSMGDIASRRALVEFSAPFGAIPIVVFVRKAATDIDRLENLAGRPVAVVRSNVGLDLLSSRTDVTVKPYDQMTEAWLALISGTVDGFVFPEFMGWTEARRLGIQDIVRVSGEPLAEVKRCMAVRRGNAALLRRLDPAIGDVVTSTEFEPIFRRWYGDEPPFWTPRRVAGAAGVLLLATIVGLTTWRLLSLVRFSRTLAAKEHELRGVIDGMQAFVAICSPDGTLLHAGGPMDPSELDPDGIGRPFWDNASHAHSPETRARVRSAVERAAAGERVREDVALRTVAGKIIVLDAAFGPIRDADGRIQRVVASGVDVTQQRATESALRRSEAALLRAERLARIGHWEWDLRASAIRWSPGMYRLFGYDPTPDEPVPLEMPLERVHPDDLTTVRANVERFLETGIPTSTLYRIQIPDGEVRWVQGEAEALTDHDGRPRVAFGFVLDVTERQRVEDALRRSESRLAEAQRIARLGSWEWNPASGAIIWSDEAFRIFGHPPQAFSPTYEGFLGAVYPEDRTRVQEAVAAALEGAPYDVHHRVVLPSGEVRVVRELGTVDRAPDGSPRRLVGTVQDVTELESTEAALRASLEEKTVLLREIHHRVKNNLQIISSMLYLHGRRADTDDVQEVLEDSRERVRAMALVHETLYQADDLGRVEFGAYLERMLAGVWAAHRPPGIDTAIEAVGPPLDIERAVPLGLVTNELVTNALKHAFPDGRRGVVRVSYHGEAGDGRFALSVADDGVGLPDGMVVEKVDSLGLRLISLLAAQLEAEFRVDGPPGARFTLTRRTGDAVGQAPPGSPG